MNKSELIDVISEDIDVTKKDIRETINEFIKVVTLALENGDKIVIVGFGTFEVKRHKKTQKRNPNTGQMMKIKARNRAKFYFSNVINEKLN